MSLALQLKDYRLTTAEILYRLPDHPGILQSYIWQELDIAPRFPVLHKFLDFWRRELDGRGALGARRLRQPDQAAIVSQPGRTTCGCTDGCAARDRHPTATLAAVSAQASRIAI